MNEKDRELEQQIAKDIEQRKKTLESKRNELETECNILKEARDKAYTEKENATRELEQKLVEIREPFNKKISALDKKIEKNEHDQWQRGIEIRYADEHIRGKYAEQMSTFTSAEAFRGWMTSKGFQLSTIEMIKKKLSNGVILFRHFHSYNDKSSDSDEVAYFAVKDKNIVGYHHTTKAQHVGDDTYREAWINRKLFLAENKEAVDEKAPDYRRSYYSHGVRFKDWVKRVESLTSFVGADLDNEENKEVIKKL